MSQKVSVGGALVTECAFPRDMLNLTLAEMRKLMSLIAHSWSPTKLDELAELVRSVVAFW
jgi:hypothetical protein